MQEQNNHAQSSEQQTLPTTAPFTNFLYSSANNFNVDSNRGQYGVMTQYSMYPMNQWPHTEGLNVPSTNMTGNQTTTASSNTDTSISNSVANNVPIMSVNQAAHISSNMDSSAVANNILPFMSTPVSSTYGVADFCQFPFAGLENTMITLSKSVLYPPNHPPTQNRSKKPFECTTIFVEGLPEKATEDIVHEVFKRVGEVISVKIQTNFCTVRFFRQSSVEFAFFFNGWEIKIENKDDAPYKGKLHIDYAPNNQHLIGSAQQEAKDDKETNESDFRPQPFVPCSEQEIARLAEKLDDEDKFEDVVRVLISWLDKGECNKRNASCFYSVIQKTNNHVQKLMNEKAKFEEDLNKAKLMLHDKMDGIKTQLQEFEKVLGTSRLQKVWDHFTKAQRKNIEAWATEIEGIKNMCSKVLNERVEVEMEISDEEVNRSKDGEICALTEQIDDLQNQLRASEQELKIVDKEKEEEILAARQSFQIMLHDTENNEKQVANFKELLANAEIKESTQECGNQPKGQHSMIDLVSGTSELALDCAEITESNIRQIGVIGTFLSSHPFGASLDYISSFLSSIEPDVNTRDIEHLMMQFPTVFTEESFGIGSTLRKKWKFSVFKV